MLLRRRRLFPKDRDPLGALALACSGEIVCAFFFPLFKKKKKGSAHGRDERRHDRRVKNKKKESSGKVAPPSAGGSPPLDCAAADAGAQSHKARGPPFHYSAIHNGFPCVHTAQRDRKKKKKKGGRFRVCFFFFGKNLNNINNNLSIRLSSAPSHF